MSTPVVMPQMGESIAEGTIVRWIKKPGDKVERDEPLFEISTDKVDAEIPSPAAGVLADILVKEGQTVPVNTVVGTIEGNGAPAKAAPKAEAAAPKTAAPPPDAPKPAAAAPAPPPRAEVPPAEAPAAKAPPTAHQVAEQLGRTPTPDELRQVRSSPLVRKMAREHDVDISNLQGTGISGRVTKNDLLQHLEGRRGGAPAAAAPTAPAPAAPVAAPAAPAASPAAFRMEPPEAAPEPAQDLSQEQVAAMFAGERVDIVAMSPMRKKIAEHMVRSRRTSAHVTTVFEMDMTNVMQLLKSEGPSFQEKHGVKLTLTPFVVRAVCDTVKKHPMINAQLVGNYIVYRKDVHMGIAVALDWGLVVPVIRNADEKNILGLCRAVNDLAGRARNKQLKPDELAGGTLTITNPGIYGGMFGTPIINQPQVAILGMGAVEKRPVVRDDAICIRSMAYFALSFDHRIIDGADADIFMADLKTYLAGFTREMM